MQEWFSEDVLALATKRVNDAFNSNLNNEKLFFNCFTECVQVIAEQVRLHTDVMHTHYVGGYLKDAICISNVCNLCRGVREALLDDLLRYNIVDLHYTNIITTRAYELAPDYPQLYRHYIICKKVDLSLRRNVFSRLKKLVKCFEMLIHEGVDREAVKQSFPRDTFGKDWILESCQIGTKRVKGYRHLKEAGYNSFRITSAGEGFVGDPFESELSAAAKYVRIFHQPYKSPYREQYDFSVQCPFVCLLRSVKTNARRAVHVDYTLLDLTLQVRDTYLEKVSAHTTNYVLSKRQELFPSLDLYGWCLRTAARAKPISAVFFAFHHMQKSTDSRKTIMHLNAMCESMYNSFPEIPDELSDIRLVVKGHDVATVPISMPLSIRKHIRGVTWISKQKSTYRSFAFVHDFFVVLRKTTNALMASHVLQGYHIDMNFVDSLTLEDM